ncbi:hypothetical protein KUV50_18455 [Membranicola marinus]|uniref:Cellulase (Glycosyl hydrolase family 5) n=1 Tax=Membranihabitans marinus TaxID=1227546 RepID=A0A953HXV1_9BACT|nr:hypothetical protein [Membranihabitans marinus]MBY5960141.1 hypothetical protein [Membranihabitans marinus]
MNSIILVFLAFLGPLFMRGAPNFFSDSVISLVRCCLAVGRTVQNQDLSPTRSAALRPQGGLQLNSGWMQDPGNPASKDTANFPQLETYLKDILETFDGDERVLLWDLYNEPGNSGKGNESMALLKNVFTWAKEVNPAQPVSVGLWNWDLIDLNIYQALHSDVLTYHCYEGPDQHTRIIELLKTHGLPMICTEYMARTNNSTFKNSMPILKEFRVGAINWGLVSGKTNTIYAWNTPIGSGEEPEVWFHDIFRKDGTPYRQDEVDLIQKLNAQK